jgi:hypothetical protein
MATDNLEVANSALLRLGAKKISSLTEDSDRARLCNAFIHSVRKQTLRAHPWNVALKRAKLNTFPNGSLVAGALTGTGITFTSSLPVFLAGRDEEALIVEHGTSGQGQARITSVTSTTEVVADIETDFSTTLAIPTEEWRLAPSWEWTYRYLKPSDYMRLAKVERTSGIGGTVTQSGFMWSWWTRGQRDNSPEPFKVENETLVSNVGPKTFVQYIFDLTDTTKWDSLLEEAIISLLTFRITYGVTGSLQAGKTHHDAWKECLAEARSIDGQEGTGDDTGSDVLLAVRG